MSQYFISGKVVDYLLAVCKKKIVKNRIQFNLFFNYLSGTVSQVESKRVSIVSKCKKLRSLVFDRP